MMMVCQRVAKVTANCLGESEGELPPGTTGLRTCACAVGMREEIFIRI